jgi:excisionase family DNA binding protein
LARSYLNVPQVAKILGVNIQTVRAYIRKGELSAAKVGRRYVIARDDVYRFIDKRKEFRKAEDVGLTEKGRENVEKVKGNALRVLSYLEDCPGASNEEITEALGFDSKNDTHRALLWLEGRNLAYSELDKDKPDRRKDPWYSRS